MFKFFCRSQTKNAQKTNLKKEQQQINQQLWAFNGTKKLVNILFILLNSPFCYSTGVHWEKTLFFAYKNFVKMIFVTVCAHKCMAIWASKWKFTQITSTRFMTQQDSNKSENENNKRNKSNQVNYDFRLQQPLRKTLLFYEW